MYNLLQIDYEILEFIDDRVVMENEIFNHFPNSERDAVERSLFYLCSSYFNSPPAPNERFILRKPSNLIDRLEINNYKLTPAGIAVLYDYRAKKKEAFKAKVLAWASFVVSFVAAVASVLALLLK